MRQLELEAIIVPFGLKHGQISGQKFGLETITFVTPVNFPTK